MFLEYYKALKNMYVDKVIEYDDFTFVGSDTIDDGIWNFVCNLKANNIDSFIKTFENSKNLFIDRTPRFYILQSEKMSRWLEMLKSKYKLYCKDTWFVTNITDLRLEYKSKINIEIKLCENKKDIIETIMKGFSTGEVNDPYGDLSPTYRTALNKTFGKEQSGYKTYHYVAYYNNQPISIATATIKDDVAYLNNLTTLKEFKGNGVAKELLSYLINQLKKQKVKTVVFATETGAYTEELYKKLGFAIADYGFCFGEKIKKNHKGV